jgi:biotin carboxylase
MSQCESRLKGFQCVRGQFHSGLHRNAFDYNWTDEQADKPDIEPDIEPDMPEQLSGHEQDALQQALNASGKLVGKGVATNDPILSKTGQTREWWRYEISKTLVAHQGMTYAGAVKGADALLEELEKDNDR